MARTLTAGVLIRHPGSGATTFLPTGSELPDWAEGIVGDHVLGGRHSTGKDAPAPVEVDITVRDADGGTVEGTVEATPAEVEVPPQSGPGSGRARWAAYAEAHGVVVGEDATRADIIDACEAAGVATED